MKKLFLLMCLFVSSTFVNASDDESIIDKAKTTVSNVVDSTSAALNSVDTSSVTKQIYSDFKSALGAIGSALKVGVEHVYMILVKQQVVKSIVNVGLWAFLLIIVIVLFTKANKLYFVHLAQCGYKPDGSGQSRRNIDMEDTSLGVASVVLFILGIVFLVSSVIFICNSYTETITGFVNPEYGAIHEIMDHIKHN